MEIYSIPNMFLIDEHKKYNFVHNDLHSSNIMFKNTELEYLYFNFKSKYFKIPTFWKNC